MSWDYTKPMEENVVWIFSHHTEIGEADLLEIDLDRDGEVRNWTQIQVTNNWLWN